MTAEKSKSVNIFRFTAPHMRAFHLSWFAFFLCFFSWFAIAPLSSLIAKDLNLTREQMANTVIAGVAFTIVARLIIGWACDKWGPRATYTALLFIGACPVAAAGLANSYFTFLLARLAIGGIGASFVITQYHTSQMFGSNCVGTANATAAGWGNMGAGATNVLMPLIVAGIATLGISSHLAWRVALCVPALLMVVCGFLYWRFTQDCPAGNFSTLERNNAAKPNSGKSFQAACQDPRVWVLGLMYGACFGIEIIIHSTASTYFQDHFKLDLKTAGLIAGAFGGLALFARALGGLWSDRIFLKHGLNGRRLLLGSLLFAQGMAMIFFAQATTLVLAVAGLLLFGVLVHTAAGATYALIPFVNRRALGSVAGIVGAGGNVGAVAAGFLFKVPGLSDTQAFFYMGLIVIGISTLAVTLRFSESDERESRVVMPVTDYTLAPATPVTPQS